MKSSRLVLLTAAFAAAAILNPVKATSVQTAASAQEPAVAAAQEPAAVLTTSDAQEPAAKKADAAQKAAQNHERKIVQVEPAPGKGFQLETPEGTAPRLPWQVWVTYNDGYKEWRQARWENSPLASEELQANPEMYPAGSHYTVRGHVIGDNTTDNGYPIEAQISVGAKDSWEAPAAKPIAEPLPLNAVGLTGDNRLTSNCQLDIDALLHLDITQQLYNYRDTYGLPTEGYTESDGWDSPTTKLKGHGSGHYMSAIAFAYASLCNEEKDATREAQKAQLKANARRMVDELRACQEMTFVWNDSLGRYWEARDLAPEAELRQLKGNWEAFDQYKKDCSRYGYGYINAIPAQHPALIEMYRAYNNEDWVWAPYYSIHKQLAGLIDIANNLDDQEISDKALLIAKDMGLWVWNRLHYRTYVKTDGDRAERQAKPGNRYEMWNMYIAGEVGGMAESLARLSEMVQDSTEKARLLEASNCFDAPAFFQPVSRNVDDVRTRHANQHIPMITGALRSYRTNGDPFYYHLALNFWNMIQGRYAYAMGGVGNGEMFRQPYTQILSMNTNVMSDWHRDMYPNPDLNETCCAYNLAKLTKDLNCYDPDDARYMDYYERVLYNQLVGSVHPTEYSTTYQYAVGLHAIKPFGNETPQSSCCGGTGAENHVKYQEAAYFVSESTLWVALYMPTTARWQAKGIELEQSCLWPAEHSTLSIRKGQAEFAMKLRVPYWATQGFEVKLNGQVLAKDCQPCSYVEIPSRMWTEGDSVEVTMPFAAHLNFGPDKMAIAATGKNETRTPFEPQWVGTLMYGPLVMASDEISTWDEASVSLHSDLSDIECLGADGESGYNGHVYTMKLADKTFRPDYWHTDYSTHYLRLNLLGEQSAARKKGKLDKEPLEQALAVARERVEIQKQWEALSVKVPEFAPWAPNGYARLTDQMAKAEELLSLADAKAARKAGKPVLTQETADAATSALNMAINTMRPGNLAEPEDLNPLLGLLTDTKEHIVDKSTPLRMAIDYADMVVQYVNDGSGTADMIERAINRLNECRARLDEDLERDKSRPRREF